MYKTYHGYKCFTYFSALSPSWRKFKISWSRIIIRHLLPRLWFPFSSKLESILLIHSANAIHNADRFDLEIGCHYTISFNKIETRMLEGNYQPNCREYDLDSENEDNFRSDCIQSCYMQYLGPNCYTTVKIGSYLIQKKILNKFKQGENNCTMSSKMNDYVKKKWSSSMSTRMSTIIL